MSQKLKYWTHWEKLKYRAYSCWLSFTCNYTIMQPKGGRVLALRCGWKMLKQSWASCNVSPGW